MYDLAEQSESVPMYFQKPEKAKKDSHVWRWPKLSIRVVSCTWAKVFSKIKLANALSQPETLHTITHTRTHTKR